LSYVNYKGLKLGEGVSKAVLYVVVASIFLIIILGLTIGGGSISNFQTVATGHDTKSWLDSSLWRSVFAAMLAAFWAYEGWSPIGYLGGEIKNPNRNLPLALVSGVLFVMLVYVTIVSLCSSCRSDNRRHILYQLHCSRGGYQTLPGKHRRFVYFITYLVYNIRMYELNTAFRATVVLCHGKRRNVLQESGNDSSEVQYTFHGNFVPGDLGECIDPFR